MDLADRLLKPPPRIVAGQAGTGWLGLITSWVAMGYGATAAAKAGALLISYDDDGACGIHSATTCQVAGWGGLLMGVVVLAVAALLGIVVARGFGPPTTWWVLPVMLGALALAPFQAAEGASIAWGWLLVSAAAAVAALGLAALVVRRGRAGLFGWIRLDGLDAREVPHRGVDQLVAPAALAAAVVGGSFAAHVLRLLAEG
ncbi:hypothetical protein [Agrococcus sp. HG114]|uniref:hypothetical protein n=1 Tax=Agrococcus sp. HG114 TaxID=2969757 RepID=UPI00215B20CF|nr:hypothetical protein [Agrococcus sp. HG114]MCR8670919.1 hypothetical protein [Agrococcus sp. HG114]